jgi:hypothetical protein
MYSGTATIGHDHLNAEKNGIRTAFIDAAHGGNLVYLDDTQGGKVDHSATSYFLKRHLYDKTKLLPVNNNSTQCCELATVFDMNVINMDIYKYLGHCIQDEVKVGGVWLDTESWQIGEECLLAFKVAEHVVSITCTSAHAQHLIGSDFCTKTMEYTTNIINMLRKHAVTKDWKITSTQMYGDRGMKRTMNMVNIQFQRKESLCIQPSLIHKHPVGTLSIGRVISDYHLEKEYVIFDEMYQIDNKREEEVDVRVGSVIGYLWGGLEPGWYRGVVKSILPSPNPWIVKVKAEFEDGVFTLLLDISMYLSTPHKIGFSWVLIESVETNILIDNGAQTFARTMPFYPVLAGETESLPTSNWKDGSSSLETQTGNKDCDGGASTQTPIEIEDTDYVEEVGKKKRKIRTLFRSGEEHLFDGMGGAESKVQATLVGGDTIFFMGSKGSERTVRIMYTNGDQHVFEGVRGQERKTSATLSNGERQLFVGERGVERKSKVFLQNGEYQLFKGRKGEERIVRATSACGSRIVLCG